MNLDTIVPTLDNCSSTLPVSCNIESSNEKIYVTLINYDGSVFTNLEIEPGKTVTLPIPTREGYRFVGWSLTKGGSDLFDFSTPIVDDITLYSVWRDRSLVHVSFYDGQKLIKDGYYKSGEKHRFPSVDYLGEEFTVYGWIKEGDSNLIKDSLFEVSNSEEEIRFKVYITTSLLSIDTNGAIEKNDFLHLASNPCQFLDVPNSINGILVTSIRKEAFTDCKELLRVTIGSSVTSIGDNAFRDCESLTSINVSEHNECYKSIDGVLFDKSGETIIFYPRGKTESEYSIPDSVTSIGDGAFSWCKSLTSIVIPDSVISIGKYAFSDCESLTSIVIPDSVTSIEDGAFYLCKSLTSIVIPDSVISIGKYAFSDCESLTSIVIPDSVTSIGDNAFRDCESLTSINVSEHNECYKSIDGVLFNKSGETIIFYPRGKTGSEYSIPDSVTSIGDGAFSWCKSLTNIVIPNSVISIGKYAFSGCKSLTSIVIPDSVTSIGDKAFSDCDSLTSIVIPDSVTSIGSNAFSGCKSLTSIVIPDSVTSIGDKAFSDCDSLTSIVIPDSVTSIGSNAFSGCKSLTSIVIPDSVTSIGGNAFSDCKSLTSINVSEHNECYKSIDGVLFDKSGETIIFYPRGKTGSEYSISDSVTSIGDRAFRDCYSLTSINVSEHNECYKSIDGVLFDKSGETIIFYPRGKTGSEYSIPDSVISIGKYAFSDCKSLTSIVIPDSVTSIGYDAFSWCKSLTSIVIPDSVTSIGDDAFSCCESLTSIVIPDSVISIGVNAFRDCKSLTSIVIPDSVTSIGDDAFSWCKSLTSIVIPDSVTSIGDDAFSFCESLTSIVIPDSVTSIGDGAFSWCESLTSIVIPDSVISIGDGAFSWCKSLTSIVIPDSVTSIKSDTFSGCAFASVVIPDTVTSIGDRAFSCCTKLTSINIPVSVASIGRDAFEGCNDLYSIHINKTMDSIPYAPWRGNVIITEEAYEIIKDYFDVVWSDETVTYKNNEIYHEFFDY